MIGDGRGDGGMGTRQLAGDGWGPEWNQTKCGKWRVTGGNRLKILRPGFALAPPACSLTPVSVFSARFVPPTLSSSLALLPHPPLSMTPTS